MKTDEIARTFRTIQDEICAGLELLDGKAHFHEDLWEREQGGGGRSRALADGDLIEKGAVNYSHVHGVLGSAAAKALHVAEGTFHATGVSIVLHGRNPHVPTIHMNVRHFETQGAQGKEQWFGGGIDLTPMYYHAGAAQLFHEHLKATCDAWSPEFYPNFKPWADEYFFLPHRQETRGVGGIFYDRQSPGRPHSGSLLEGFTFALARSFVPLYSAVVAFGRHQPYGHEEVRWQRLRRGRYVEFNLLHDRGTRFGLDSGGRTESILMSLPPDASWEYDHTPPAGSPEAGTLLQLRKGIDRLSDK
jgi:coproporphyrinogen III oxidase